MPIDRVQLPNGDTEEVRDLRVPGVDSVPTSGSANLVTSGGVKSALDAKEDVSNKVTTVTSSSTDTQYPSAKAVYDAIEDKQDTINTVNVTVDNNTGTPSATASVSNDTLNIAFHNLKGATGATGPQGPQGIQGEQGPQGNTGSSVDYPYELVNNLETNDATKGLTAAQGKVIGDKLSTLAPALKEASGQFVTFDDAAAGTRLSSAVADIDYNAEGVTGATVRATGKNLFGGDALRTQILTGVSGSSAPAEGQARWKATSSGSIIPNLGWKENTVYTIVLTLYRSTGSTAGTSYAANALIYYTDGTTTRVTYRSAGSGVFVTIALKTNASKTFDRISSANHGGNTTVDCAHCGVFEGNIDLEDFEIYDGEAHVIDWSEVAGTIYGGSLDLTNGKLTSTLAADGTELETPGEYDITPVPLLAKEGVNTIWADTGDTEVVYSLNPSLLAKASTALQPSDIVDNLSDGGTDVPLSAEQGKVLGGENVVIKSRIGEPMYHCLPVTGVSTIGAYINGTSNKWESSSAADSFMLPIIPGRRYFVRAFATRAGRIAVLTTDEVTLDTVPSYAEGFSSYVALAAGEDYSFVAPADAAFLNVASKLSADGVRPDFIMEEMSAEESIESMAAASWIATGHTTRIVDARVDSETFGKALTATDNDWASSDLVCVRGYKKIRYPRRLFSTSSNYGGKGGDMFFDKNFEPITDGVWLMKLAGTALLQFVEVEVPENAWYFRITFTPGGSNEAKTIHLISGSTDGCLEYRNSVSQKPYVYYGQRIDLGNSYDYRRFATNGVSNMQSCACFGDNLFLISDGLAKVVLYDLKTLTQVYTLNTGITSESHWHCNQASFSTKYYDENDPFPVLYISMQNNGNGRCEAHGYRIIPTYTDEVLTSFTIELVQTVFLPAMTDENCLGNANVTFDTQKGWMWTYSRNKNEQAANYGKARLTRFAIPELTESTVTLEDSDILEAFSDDFNMALAQGGFIHNGKLVIFQGYASAGYINCHVVDLYLEKKRVSWIDMLGDGFVMEPEGAFWYDGKIHFTTATVHMYRIEL